MVVTSRTSFKLLLCVQQRLGCGSKELGEANRVATASSSLYPRWDSRTAMQPWLACLKLAWAWLPCLLMAVLFVYVRQKNGGGTLRGS